MAVISGWWPSVNGDRKYYIEQQAAVNAQIYSNGVLPVGDQFQVQATEGFTVKITAGYAWLNGYWILNDSDYALTLSAPDGVLGRMDLIVLRWQRESRETVIAIKKGALASTPAAPDLQRDADVYELCLARILVAAGVTAISQANITDTRTDSALCGLSSLYDPPSSDAWFAQFNASFNEWFASTDAQYDAWFASLQTDFDAWYQSVKDLLSEEVAVQLSERIDAIDVRVTSVESDIDGAIKELYRGSYTILSSDWSNGHATISNAHITTETDVDFVISNAQKGEYALTLMDPETAGQVTATMKSAPDEDITGTLIVYGIVSAATTDNNLS